VDLRVILSIICPKKRAVNLKHIDQMREQRVNEPRSKRSSKTARFNHWRIFGTIGNSRLSLAESHSLRRGRFAPRPYRAALFRIFADPWVVQSSFCQKLSSCAGVAGISGSFCQDLTRALATSPNFARTNVLRRTFRGARLNEARDAFGGY